MSKEQTPIEEKDLNYYKDNCEPELLHTPISVLRYIGELEKEIKESKAKVLEALEREVIKARTIHGIWSSNDAKRYYETEVKPKYKQINK